VTGPADLEATISLDGDLRTNHTWQRIVDPTEELPGRPAG
jgi:hypothetical protein